MSSPQREETHFGDQRVPLAEKQGLVDDVFHKVADRYDLPVLAPPIPRTVRFAEASASGSSVMAGRKNKGAVAYSDLAQALLRVVRIETVRDCPVPGLIALDVRIHQIHGHATDIGPPHKHIYGWIE